MSVTCTRSSIEDVFGKENVRKWADIDGDNDPSKITSRITDAISFSQADLYSRFRDTQYKVPFEGTDTLMDELWAHLAGLWLHKHKSIMDYDPETKRASNPMQHLIDWVDTTIEEIRADKRILALTLETEDYPEAVETDLD